MEVLAQDLIIIWHLWVLSSRKWKFVVIPLIIEAAHISAGYLCCTRAALGKDISDPITHDATLTTWILDLSMNVGVTSLIVYRLYLAGKTINNSGLLKTNKYFSIYTMVESGLAFAAAIAVMVGMFLANMEAVAAAADVVEQLAVLTPLLIMCDTLKVRHDTWDVDQQEPGIFSNNVCKRTIDA
ncbi:hypothetical protein H0H92_004384 [Tricholoma furcatifolium]|nr:hypothetical protein H0H92_004384 [Tricholoma furcatifolium]